MNVVHRMAQGSDRIHGPELDLSTSQQSPRDNTASMTSLLTFGCGGFSGPQRPPLRFIFQALRRQGP